MVRSVKPDVMAKIRVAQDMQPGCKQAGRQTSSVAVPAQLGDPEWNGPWCMLIRQLLIDRPNPAIPLCNGNVTRCGKVPHLVAADLLLLDLLHGVVVQRRWHEQQVHLRQLPLRPSLWCEHAGVSGGCTERLVGTDGLQVRERHPCRHVRILPAARAARSCGDVLDGVNCCDSDDGPHGSTTCWSHAQRAAPVHDRT